MFLLNRLPQHRLLLNKNIRQHIKTPVLQQYRSFLYIYIPKIKCSAKTNSYHVKFKIYPGEQRNRYRTSGSKKFRRQGIG